MVEQSEKKQSRRRTRADKHLVMPGVSAEVESEAAKNSIEQQAVASLQHSLEEIAEASNSNLLSMDGIREMFGDDSDKIIETLQKAVGVTGSDTVVRKLAGGRKVEFTLQTFAQSEIEDRTKVAENNPRSHSVISRVDVEDILHTLNDPAKGELDKPAFGYMDVDGKVACVDGRRRRFAVTLADTSPRFKVYVCDSPLSIEDIAIIDRVEEATVSKTAVELGRWWLRIKDENNIGDIKELAIKVGRPLSTVETNCGLAAIREEVVSLSYVPSKLGITLLRSLKKIDFDLDDDELVKLKNFRNDYIEENKRKLSSLEPVDANKRLIDALIDESARLLGVVKHTGAKAIPIMKLKSKNMRVVKKRDYNDNSKTHIAGFEIKGLPKDVTDELYEGITQMIKATLKEKNLVADS